MPGRWLRPELEIDVGAAMVDARHRPDRHAGFDHAIAHQRVPMSSCLVRSATEVRLASVGGRPVQLDVGWMRWSDR
jgi:hypothetical protein